MLVKPDQKSSPSSSATTTAAQTTCGNCGVEELRFLHHVRHRGAFRRLCSSCVLRLHPSSFCPVCFAVYDSSSPPPFSAAIETVSCSKCYSTTHAACAGPNPPNPYVCPVCVNPSSPIFAPKKLKDLASENPDAAASNGVVGKDAANGDLRVIDQRAARVLLAAAKISADSMSKAAVAARAEAERRAREAAFSRKRARAALEHVAYIVAKEKLKKRGAAAPAPGGAGGMVVDNSSVSRSNNNHNNVGNANAASVVRAGTGMVREERRVGNVGRGDGSSDVLAALNAVELREGEKKMGRQSGLPHANDVVPMDVEENGRVKANGGLSDGRAAARYHGGASENRGGLRENVSNGDVSSPVERKNNAAGH